MPYRWTYSEPENMEVVASLREELGVPEKIARLLALRGIDSFDHARSFFRPDIAAIHDPFLMKDMDRATERLSKAIRDRERILIYGDYDVDGTTATSVLYLFLLEFGVEVDYYIPHRYREGYGISSDGIGYAAASETDLIISVDCGITAVEETRTLREKGIDLIICDHHNVGPKIPDAAAVLDPKRTDCSYPFDGLSGAGVGFKLVQGTIETLGLDPAVGFRFLDLVAISIASDIVPITGENRILMREGLRRINTEPRIGIRSLLEQINMKPGTVTSSSIIFSIGPRINAAGRMGNADRAVQLLTATGRPEAEQHARELESINRKRREEDSRTMESAVSLVEQRFDLEKTSAMVLHQPDWHLGVIGIVASRLVDAYGRPVVMLSTVDGQIRGSARSISGFNIYRALEECGDLLEQFGGHEYAAGMTIREENLAEFIHRLDEVASRGLKKDDFIQELSIDCDIDLSDLNLRFWKLLSQFEPYGPGNARPTFVSRNIRVVGVPTVVGSGHLKMKVAQNGSGVFDVIGFNMHEHLPTIRNCRNGTLNIAYALEENVWRGRRTLQINLQDLKVE